MVRDGRLADVEAIDDIAGAHRVVLGGDQAKDIEPGRIGQRLERRDQRLPFRRRQRDRIVRDGATALGPDLDAHGGILPQI
jgi:hypothetical protein